jgi:hypothetical protein
MCVICIPWICCKGYNFPSMCVINWIKSMGGPMSYCHKNRKKKGEQRRWQKKVEAKKVIQFMVNTPMLCKLGN